MRTTRAIELTDEGRLLSESLGDLRARVLNTRSAVDAARVAWGACVSLCPATWPVRDHRHTHPRVQRRAPGVILDVRFSDRARRVAAILRRRHHDATGFTAIGG